MEVKLDGNTEDEIKQRWNYMEVKLDGNTEDEIKQRRN